DTHRVVDGQVMALSAWLLSIVTGVGVPTFVGSHVTNFDPSVAVHWLVVGQDTPPKVETASIVVAPGEPGAVGSKVIARPPLSTAVNCVHDGHETPQNCLPLSIVTAAGLSDPVGSKVSSRPASSTRVHCV